MHLCEKIHTKRGVFFYMANELLNRMKKVGTISASSVLANSIYFISNETFKTDLPILNIALSGDPDGGACSGVTVIAGESKTFKSMSALFAMKSYLEKYEDAVAVFYDSEFGTPIGYMKALGIDIERVIHIPVTNIDELKFDIVKKLEEIKRGDHVFFFVDSIGNLASRREYNNAMTENEAKDMSRSQDIKGFFRIITPHVVMKDVPCFVISHTYKEQTMYPKSIVSGGCLIAGTFVLMADGTKKAIEEIKVGDIVKTRYGDKAVTHVWNPETLEEGTPECVKLVFSDGFKVVCSKRHKFLLSSGAWVEAENIKEGDSLMMPDKEKLILADSTPVGNMPVYDIAVDGAEHYFLENGICSHNSGIMYSANVVLIFSRTQEKDSKELVGYNFTINVNKSRFVKEGSRLTFTVLHDTGIVKYSGLMEIALESGDVIIPAKGWYQKVDTETGEVSEKKYRMRDTFTADFWESILASRHFREFVKNQYQLGAKSLVTENSEIKIPELDEEYTPAESE